ncbi:putative defense protein Hdd11-like [Daphnia pulex]|uniref:putative defense protein Hdd11-like n=1 Tax=Daphnia pulex TaxID=6669 RepID=UPI001EE0D4A8|nr:putative defense protein Hdd11-like [Daphnia pulex]
MSYNMKAAFTCAAVSVLLLILAGPIQVQGLSSGAPTAACISMIPGHGPDPQTGPSPFVTVVSDKMVSTNTPIMMDLHPSNIQNPFKGYLVMAFDTKNPSVAIGTFKQSNNGKLIDCHSGLNNAATHSDPSPKTSVKLEWTPPSDYSGQVIFRTTFVKERMTFWVKTESETVTIGGPPSTASTTTAPVTPKKNLAPSQFVSVTCGNLIFLSLLIFLVR